MGVRCETAIVGIGTTEYYRRGGTDKSIVRLACEAILAACDDAGLDVSDIDGFSSYSDEVPPSVVAPTLGVPYVRSATMVWGGGGGGSCAAIGNAVAAVAAGYAETVVLYHAVRRTEATRFGGQGGLNRSVNPWTMPYGLLTPAQCFAMIVRRHMHEYGTRPEHLAALCMTQRDHAVTNPRAMMRSPLTEEDYFASRLITDPFRLYDCCLENDGGGALIVTSAARARDLKQKPAYILATSQGGAGAWGNALFDQNAPLDLYPTAGHRPIADQLYGAAGVQAQDIKVAEIYDHFSGMVLLQLEDYGFCKPGDSGPFVAAGEARFGTGQVAVNTHGGNLSEVNLHGTTHLIEGVRQIRGTAANQVEDAELCLVTGGPSPLPSSSMILSRKDRS
jgi:acetyl-CoA acetyltransferase